MEFLAEALAELPSKRTARFYTSPLVYKTLQNYVFSFLSKHLVEQITHPLLCTFVLYFLIQMALKLIDSLLVNQRDK